MLTYATIADFRRVKDVNKDAATGAFIDPAVYTDREDKWRDYLASATRFIRRMTRRHFFPYCETKKYPIPHRFIDLRMRQYLSANLLLDEDLLETLRVTNGVRDLVPDQEFFLLDANIYPKTEIALRFPVYWGSGGVFKNIQYPVIEVQGLWGYHDEYGFEAWLKTYECLPVYGITADQTEIELGDVDGEDEFGLPRFAEGNLIRVENELMEVTGVNTTTNKIMVVRGVRGSAAVEHPGSANIRRWRVHEDIVRVTIQVAKVWREAEIAYGGRIGTADLSQTVELNIPSDPLMVIKMYQKTMGGNYGWN